MARKSRKRALSGIYHVILRGNNKQNIFEDDEDRLYFLEKLLFYKVKFDVKIYAYCLMDNHVHLLVKEGSNGISDLMKRIAGGYSYWFNRKYGRIGHLYQERFKSEPVENERYFLTVLRYIHSNPVKAGITRECGLYDWSSYLEYQKGGKMIDSEFVFNLIKKDDFILFHNQKNKDECLDIKNTVFRFMTDKNALRVIKEILSDIMVDELSCLEKSVRDGYIRIFRSAGMSIKQISRLTGISEGIIRRQKLMRYK